MPRRLFLAYRSAGILFALAAVVVAAASCAPLAGLFGSGDTTPRTKPVQDAAGFWHYSGETPLYQGARPVRLTNNPQATDPTWDALSAFILSDPTDAELYAPGLRVCSEFANTIHDNAEASGIRAAWVAIEFTDGTEGHALNAFETSDRGLVFIDCTGTTLRPLADEITPSQQLTEIYNNHDKVAYISINREIGFIPVRLAQTPEYESYESYLGQWRQLEQLELNMDRTEREIAALAASIDNEKTAYDGKLGGRVSLAEPEYSQMGAWLARINASVERYNGLIDSYNAQVERYNEMITGLGGGQYDPMAIVSRVEIYW